MSESGFTIAPWEMMEGESALAFSRFVIYRDLGASRTIELAVDACRTAVGEVSARQLERHSSEYRWVERARAYDAYMDQLFMKERARQREQARTKSLEVVGRLKDIALDALEAKLEEASELDLAKISTVIERMDRIESRLLGTHAPIQITTPAGQPFQVQTQVFTKEQLEDLGAESLIDIIRNMDD